MRVTPKLNTPIGQRRWYLHFDGGRQDLGRTRKGALSAQFSRTRSITIVCQSSWRNRWQPVATRPPHSPLPRSEEPVSHRSCSSEPARADGIRPHIRNRTRRGEKPNWLRAQVQLVLHKAEAPWQRIPAIDEVNEYCGCFTQQHEPPLQIWNHAHRRDLPMAAKAYEDWLPLKFEMKRGSCLRVKSYKKKSVTPLPGPPRRPRHTAEVQVAKRPADPESNASCAEARPPFFPCLKLIEDKNRSLAPPPGALRLTSTPSGTGPKARLRCRCFLDHPIGGPRRTELVIDQDGSDICDPPFAKMAETTQGCPSSQHCSGHTQQHSASAEVVFQLLGPMDASPVPREPSTGMAFSSA